MVVKGAIQRMAKKKAIGTRVLAAILTAAMVFTSAPYTALAAESEAGFMIVQNEIEQSGENGQAGGSEAGQRETAGAGDVSDGSSQDTGAGDVSDGSSQDTGAGDISDNADSEASVSDNDIAVYSVKKATVGSLTVEGSSADYSYNEETNIITVKNGAKLVFHSAKGYGEENPSKTAICVEKDADATITLDGVYIDVSDIATSMVPAVRIEDDSTGDVNIILKGENSLKSKKFCAAIQKNGDGETIGMLTISGEGSLTATGGEEGAGIGSESYEATSRITITGGTITTTGGEEGAGIGSGWRGAASNITISGGTITANGGYLGAGIGSGRGGNANKITINSGTVTATGNGGAAGIGGGHGGAGMDITITGGTVTARSSTSEDYKGTGAGIGGGYAEAGTNITISGGIVTATSSVIGNYTSAGAGIGGGYDGAGTDITITGGTVTAMSSAIGDYTSAGAGIGGGYAEAGTDITIMGGTVTAETNAIGERANTGAGIGGGSGGVGNRITISGGTVTATTSGTGIVTEAIGGDGFNTDPVIISIIGGNVKASSSGEITDADSGKVYPVRVDLLTLRGRAALIGDASVQTCNRKTGETETISYDLSKACTMKDGYLYMYLPADTQDTVTRLVLGTTVYEATVKELDYDGTEVNEFTLKSDADGNTDLEDVPVEDIPEEGGIPDGIWMAGLQADGYTYTGKAVTPSFRVYDGRKLLTEKKDYTVSYKNNINAASAADGKKAPTITVKSTGNYQGTATGTFTIKPASLSENEQRFQADDLYLAAPAGKNPKGIKAVPVVTDNGKKLAENKDYTVSHVTLNEQNKENKNANSYVNPGKYTVEIVGKGNYTGTRQIAVTLTDVANEQILMSKVTVAKVPDVTYDADLCEGSGAPGMTPALTVTYGSGKNKVTLYKEGDVNAAGETVSAENADYTVIWLNNKQAGTATAILNGTGKILEDGTVSGQYFGEKRITFKIKGVALSANMVSWADGSKNVSVVYNGEEQKPEVKVSLQKKVKGADGKTVMEVTVLSEYNAVTGVGDYKVSYLKNVDAGTATVVVTGVGGYTGTVKKTFKITQADLSAADMEAKIAASGAQNAYGAIKVSFVKNGAKPAVVVTAKLANGNTVTLTEGKDYTVTYANNKAVSEGKNLTEKKLPLITVKGKGNFKGSMKQTFTITNKSLADEENPIAVTVADVAANKNKGKFVSKPVITDENGTKLKEKTDYTLTYSLLTEGGAVELDTKTGIVNEPGSVVRVTITGAGNYQGEGSVLTADYRITELDFTKATIKIVPKSFTYTGKPVTLTGDDLKITMKVGTGKQTVVEELPLVTDENGKTDGYRIVGYQNNINKGTAQVTLQGCGKYGGTKTVKFYIGTRPFFWWIMP